jgi:fumarate hydratase class II
MQIERDSLGKVEVAAHRLWGAKTQPSLAHFSISKDLIPREMIGAYAVLKRQQQTRTTLVNDSRYQMAEGRLSALLLKLHLRVELT